MLYNAYRTRAIILIYKWLPPGANDFGQLGDGTEDGRKHPKKVKQLQTEFVKSISCGAHCTAAIAEPREKNGIVSTSRLWVWGQNQVVFVTSISLLYPYHFLLTSDTSFLLSLSLNILICFFPVFTGIKLSTFILGGFYSKYGT